MEVSIIWTAASWVAASASMMRPQTPARRQRTNRLWQVVYGPNATGRSRQGAPDRKTQKMPLRTRRSFTRNATWLVRQHRPYGSPFIVGEFVAHDSSPQSGSLNHRGLTHRKELLARPWFGVFGAGADINLPTILNETVENDPKQR